MTSHTQSPSGKVWESPGAAAAASQLARAAFPVGRLVVVDWITLHSRLMLNTRLCRIQVQATCTTHSESSTGYMYNTHTQWVKYWLHVQHTHSESSDGYMYNTVSQVMATCTTHTHSESSDGYTHNTHTVSQVMATCTTHTHSESSDGYMYNTHTE